MNFKIIKSAVALLLVVTTVQMNAQTSSLDLKYLGTAGWVMSDDSVTILVDPYISRIKLGEGPSISEDDHRKSYSRTDYFESDTVTNQ